MRSFAKEKWNDMIDAFNSASRYLHDLLNIDNSHLEQMVHRIYPAEPQLNKANASNIEAAFLDLNLSTVGLGRLKTLIMLFNRKSGQCFRPNDYTTEDRGFPGHPYGDPSMSTLHLGSGGGSGGNALDLSANPKGT